MRGVVSDKKIRKMFILVVSLLFVLQAFTMFGLAEDRIIEQLTSYNLNELIEDSSPSTEEKYDTYAKAIEDEVETNVPNIEVSDAKNEYAQDNLYFYQFPILKFLQASLGLKNSLIFFL